MLFFLLVFTTVCLLTFLSVSAPTTAGPMNPVRDPSVLEIPISVPTVINILDKSHRITVMMESVQRVTPENKLAKIK